MNLDHFRVFVVVAKHRNVTRASEELNLTQPAVTNQLKLMEDAYGVRLYIKNCRGIELTQAGKIFLASGRSMLRQHEKLKNRLKAIAPKAETDSLIVGGSYNSSTSLLAPILARFNRTHPLVKLSLRTDTKEAIERMVQRGQVEVAVVNYPPKSKDLVVEPLRQEELVVFASANHLWAKKCTLTLVELARKRLVIRGERDGGLSATEAILGKMKDQGLDFNIAMRCESPEAVKAAVKRKMGTGILFKSLIEDDVKSGKFKIINVKGFKSKGQSYITYHNKSPLSLHAKAFLAVLRQRAARSRSDVSCS